MNKNPPSTAAPRSSRLVMASAAVWVALILVFSLGSVYYLRGQEIANWRHQLDTLSLVLASQTDQSMAAAEIASNHIVDHVNTLKAEDPKAFAAAVRTEAFHQFMRDTISGLPQADVATLVDTNGDVINFTRTYPTPAINLADRDYFKAHAQTPALGLFISLPVKNKGNGKWVFYLSHRLNDAKGNFMGLVLVGVSVDQLFNFYRDIASNLGEGAAITLYRDDFSVLTRWPASEDVIGKKNLTGSTHTVIAELNKRSDVLYTDKPRFFEGGAQVARLGAVRAVEQFPLIINLTVTESLFLANWGQTAKTILALALASILALLTATHFLLRMARERDASMVVLTQQADQLQQAAGVFTHAREGITITSLDGQILDVNAAFTQIMGFERDEVIGRKPSMLSSGRHDKAFFETMWKTLLSDGHWSGEIWNRRKNGELYIEMLIISTVRDAHGIPQRFVALFSDITVAKAHQYQLEHIAHFDALTGLPNRVLLGDRLDQALLQTQRRKRLLAVAYIDLDGFKQVNDTYGHAEGDQLLITVTQRIKQVLREGDTLARLGGDEFVAILADLSEAAACTNTLSRLLEAVAQPMRLGNSDASVGVTFYPQANEVDADMLLRQSDQAMYRAKLAGTWPVSLL